MAEYAFEGGKRASTTISWSFESQTLPADASYAFSRPIGPLFQDTVRAAFARWSSVSGLNFVESADAAANAIRIGFGDFPGNTTVGETVYSYVGGILRPDTLVRLLDPGDLPLALANGAWTYGDTGITLFQVVLHEIGHALGLAHSSDPTTIMFPVATSLNQDLSTADVLGIDTLYPLYTVRPLDPMQAEGDAGTTPFRFLITRAGDPSLPLTITFSVSGGAAPGFVGSVAAGADTFVGAAFPTGQVTFAAGSTTTVLTVGVQGNTLDEGDRGFNVALGSLNANDSVTVRGDTGALVLDDDGRATLGPATIGVYRFFSTVDGTHFFTADKMERNALLLTRPDLTYEGPVLPAIAHPEADASAAPVFRFFDTIHGTHFYTVSAAERDTSRQTRPDLVYEGIAFYEHATAQPGDAAVYRFFDDRLGTHFYTSSRAEHDGAAATRSDLVDEGIGFWAPTS